MAEEISKFIIGIGEGFIICDKRLFNRSFGIRASRMEVCNCIVLLRFVQFVTEQISMADGFVDFE